MSYYLTTTEFLNRMGQTLCEGLTGLGAASTPTLTAELTTIIDRDESIIHGFIGGRYTVPLTNTDGKNLAEEWTYKLAQYDVHCRGAGDDVQTKVRLGYEDTMRLLRDIRDGNMAIPGAGAPTSANNVTTGLVVGSNAVRFDWDGDAENTY
jgi:phage gp36-like protein